MNKSSGKKKHKLSVEIKYDFKLIGIASHDKDYKLIFALNNALELNFEKQEDHVVYNKKLDVDQRFSYYRAEENNVVYNLISNRSQDGYLADEINNFDYFLQIIGAVSSEDRNKIIKKIRETENVLTAIKIDPNCLVSKNKLIV